MIELERVSRAVAKEHPDGASVGLHNGESGGVYVLTPHAMTPEERAVIAAVENAYPAERAMRLLPFEFAIAKTITALRESRKPKPRFVQFQTNAFKDTESGQFYDAGRESYRIVDLLNELHAKAAK